MYEIENAILQESSRGMDILREHCIDNFCEKAAIKLLQCDRSNVFIVTGFYVNDSSETDGPIGAYFLAKALKKLHFNPIIITERYCENYFGSNPDVLTLYFDKRDNLEEYKNLLQKHNPVCLISVERCGRSTDQKYYNMRKEDITEYTASLDDLFILANGRILTIGIGDGGNEIGMGKFEKIIDAKLNVNSCIVDTDETIISTISNWGAYGLISYLELFSNNSLLPTFGEVNKYLDYILELGAVDGVTGIKNRSVDGFDWNTEKLILSRLKNIINTIGSNNFSMPD